MTYISPAVPKGRQANTRPRRWSRACTTGLNAIAYVRDYIPEDMETAEFGELPTDNADVLTALRDIESAVGEIEGLKEEYADWQGNLPESLQGSATAEKLDEIENLEIPDIGGATLDELEEFFNNAEAIDLPRGYGKD